MAEHDKTVRIDKTYLTEFQTYLTGVLGELKTKIGKSQPLTGDPNTWLPALDSALKVTAGGSGFGPAALLNQKLSALGGSVETQLKWLEKLLTGMIADLGTTIESFEKNETLNNDNVEKFFSYFDDTVTDLK
jgi:hypothetical protein